MSIIDQQFQLNLDRVGILISATTLENTVQFVKIFTKNQSFSEEAINHRICNEDITLFCSQGLLMITSSQQNDYEEECLLDIFIMPNSLCIFN